MHTERDKTQQPVDGATSERPESQSAAGQNSPSARTDPTSPLKSTSFLNSGQGSNQTPISDTAKAPEGASKYLPNFVVLTAKLIADVGLMCVEVPRTLYAAGRSTFIVSSVANVVLGAQAFALTWAGALFGGMIAEKQAVQATDFFNMIGVLGLLHFSGRWFESIADYQASVGQVDTPQHLSSRLISGLLGQKLAQLSDTKFTNSASVAHTNQWVPYNLGSYFFPILRQASSLVFLASAIAFEASPIVIACAAGMTIPPIITTMINAHLSNIDEVAHAQSTSKGWKIDSILTLVDYLRRIKIDGTGSLLQSKREEFLNPGMEAKKRRAQISFHLNSAGAVVFASCLGVSLWSIGSAALSGAMDSTKALLLSGVILQVSQAVSGVVGSLIQLKLAAPALQALRDIEASVEHPPPVEQTLLQGSQVPGLKLHNASVKAPGRDEIILHDISVTIGQGTVVALFGPQGCGKTTLLDILAGLRAPGSDAQIKILIGDNTHNLADIHPYEWLRAIAYCSQHPQVYSSLTLRENIVVEMKKDYRTTLEENQFIAQILDFIGKPEWKEKLDIRIGLGVGEQNFSGGELQLIAIARALFKRPKLLFLDEAFTNLPQKTTEDLINGVRMLNTLIGWQPTVIMVSHDTRQNQYADMVVLLSAKQHGLLGCGSHRQLYAEHPEYKKEADALRGP